MKSGSDEDHVYKVRLIVETSGEVYVRASSPEAAAEAVRADLLDGGTILADDLIHIDETAPQERVSVAGTPEPCEDGTSAGYYVNESGSLEQS